MATQRPALHANTEALASLLLAEREVVPRAQVIATQASARLGGAAVSVYIFDPAASPRWTCKASVGEVKAPAHCEALTLAMVADQREPLLFSGDELVREHYAHLDVRRTIVSLLYVPLQTDGNLLGAIEAVSLDRAFTRADLASLAEMSVLSAESIASAASYENDRNDSLNTITRLTAFYDVERTFHSTLHIHRLLPIIASKIRELLPCDAVNVWMVDGESLTLMARDGADPTTEIGAIKDDLIEWVADKGKPLLVRDRNNPILKKRQAVDPDFIRGVLAIPVIDTDAIIGAIECVNKGDGKHFDEDDHFLLATIAETAAQALHNSSLLEAEKKIEILETLVEVSNEITATLNLDRVMQISVNGPQRIMRYDRAALALEAKGKLRVKAISGKAEVSQTDPAVKRITELLEWSALSEEPVHVRMDGKSVVADREETRVKFQAYFAETGMRAWYAIPLADEQGRLGVLGFESRDPNFITETHFEFLSVVAAQVTVALRNASLYEEVPLIGVLEPIMQKKRAFQRMGPRRRTTVLVLAAAALLFFVAVPLPMRVSGDSVVSAQSSADIQTEIEGVVRRVYVHEGDHVVRGTVLADMEDWDYRSALAAAEARRAIAMAAMNRALASNDGTEAGIQKVQAEYWAAETARARDKLEHTKVRSPIDGVIATPHIETFTGKRLDVGDTFARVINSSSATIDVTIDETDVALLQPGDKAAVRLDSFPTRKFIGRVDVVSPASQAQEDTRVFFARVNVPNPDGSIRPGMSGLAKVSVGWKPAGYVAFRGIGMWGWAKLWGWLGW
jgi:RND family efflux transporter MFP subunit